MASTLPKLVILGRNGIINAPVEGGLKGADDFKALPGALAAISQLNHAGIKVCLISNEPGIADGTLDYDGLFAINDRLERELAEVGGHLDGIAFCPHAIDRDCDCRPPKPGLLEEIHRRTQISLDGVPVVCTDEDDARASRAAGASPVVLSAADTPDSLQAFAAGLLDLASA